MQAGPIQGYQEAAARAGKHLKLGENLTLGIHFFVAKTREEAVRRIAPLYEEHVKMFAPLGLEQVSEEHRTAVVLRDVMDLDYAEIAEVLRVPIGTVRSRIARGRAALATAAK